MENLWWAAALLGSFLTSAYIYTNQILKIPSSVLMVYRGLGQVILFLPFIFFFTPVSDWRFYALCSIQGCLIAFNDYRLFRSSKAFGAEVTSSVQPLSIGLIFMVWLLLKPMQFWELWAQPLHFFTIILCLCGIIYAISKIRNTKASKRALGYLLPVLIAISFNDVINKQCMSFATQDLPSVIYFYCLITGFVCGITNLYAYLRHNRFQKLFQPQYIKSGLIVIFFVSFVIFAKNISMYLTPNPAYASAIILLYPLWIMFGNNIYCRVSGRKMGYRGVDKKLLFILLISIIGLVFMNK